MKFFSNPRRNRKIGLKRVSDTALIVALSPVVVLATAATAAATAVFMGRPVLFKQVRTGRGEKPFTLYKFRSMLSETDARGRELSSSERMTPFGAFLRKSSLDELPQLWNVLRGDMSLIGPRPLQPFYLPYYLEDERVRHDVRPGITGLAQISGRNEASWDDRFARDRTYVENLSLKNDLDIFKRTVQQVIKSDGVVADPDGGLEDLDVLRRDLVDLEEWKRKNPGQLTGN